MNEVIRYNDKNSYREDLKYWSNCCGDLHHFGKHAIEEKDLPIPLLRAFKELFEENKDGLNVYLVRYKDNDYIALIAEYYDDDEFPLECLPEKVATYMAEHCGFPVILAEKLGFEESTEVVVLMPPTIDKSIFDNVSAIFGKVAYNIKMATEIHFWDSGHNYEQGILVNDQIICLSTGEVIPVTEDVIIEYVAEWSPCVF